MNRLRRRWIEKFGSRRLAEEFERDWGDLCTYNSEVHRGVVHTPEQDEWMAKKQQDYNRWIASRPYD